MTEPDRNRKEQLAGVFSRAAPTYDQAGPGIFAYFGRRLVEFARLESRQRVLDVATGRGAVLFPAAERVAPAGRVVGIDLAPGMVMETRAELDRRGTANAAVQVMDAERLDFADASFDCVLCGFALFFFPRKDQALAEFHRVLRPGGQLVLSTWGDDDGLWQWFDDLLAGYVPRTAAQLPGPRFSKPAEIDAALGPAGFVNIEIVPDEAEFVYADEHVWWESLWSHGMRGRLERLAPDDLERLKTEALGQARARKQPDGLHTLERVLLTRAQKPEAPL